MEQRILSYIREQNMIREGSRGIAAVSGGADSMCLMHMLHLLAPELHTEFTVCHVIHGIRGEEALRDAEHVRREAERLGLPCRVFERNVPKLAEEQGLSLEEAGRAARYSCLEELKRETGAEWIALAHQKEDQAETVLFHILRGTGIRGLRGIRPVQGDRIRPLLTCSRGEIEAWLCRRGITYCTDSTNLEDTYTRNKLRNQIIPMLEEINPGVKEHMLSLAKEADELYDIQEQMVQRLRVHCSYRRSDGTLLLNEDVVAGRLMPDEVNLPDSLPEETDMGGDTLLGELILLEMGCIAGRRKDLTREHTGSVLALFRKETGKRVDLPYDMEAVRTYQGVTLRRKKIMADAVEQGKTAGGSGQNLSILVEKRPYAAGDPIPTGEHEKMIDAAAVVGEIRLRTPKQEDEIAIHENGGRKKLSRFFTDRKIPREEREAWPVVADDQKVIWVVGLRLAENCKITEFTKEVYIIRIADQSNDCMDG